MKLKQSVDIFYFSLINKRNTIHWLGIMEGFDMIKCIMKYCNTCIIKVQYASMSKLIFHEKDVK